jgi:hypothetical protein
MSGGRYNYAYGRIEDFAYEFAPKANTPKRKAFLRLLGKVAKAAKAIEWNDSGDGAPDEDDLIKAALGEDHRSLCLTELIQEATIIIQQIEQLKKEVSHD